ncbi:phosphotransferase [Candidatus Epulonipiscioides gigas]|nr:phosphotransferase [Epulopiscium sp. SCG-C07WGA-EpuloA2]
MKSFLISLETIAEVQTFVNLIGTLDSDFDLVSGRYVIDAKSILGILSLDISKPIELRVYSYKDEMHQKLKDYILEEIE